ncbi:3' terminal RNA ribose 2'-O-methyltransferase Hen1 [Pseudokineococcus sp. 1T1Z-3]|uniref:3' terminal RNA ribose 2'-O-methyltransferase Hen1 n=1 Tax=Pseudokineococcus sp. 1T1Z-3 TaxID=3132745 RepID=UPI003096CE00
MLLTLTATSSPALPDASDLGYLLHKHPARVQGADLPVGRVTVFYPEASPERCTAALLLEVDPVEQARGAGRPGWALGRYVSERPYASSSALAVAMARVLATALRGRCDARPDLVGAELDLDAHVPAAAATGAGGGGADLAERLFAPLGWHVDAAAVPLDPQLPRWGDAGVVDLRLRGRLRLADALTHLYVLLPVLAGAKHYWVSAEEVDKLLRAAGTWLPQHPERELVTRRYLASQRSYVDDASARLAALEGVPDADDPAPGRSAPEVDGDAPRARPLAVLRREAVLAELERLGAARVVDLGCGEGALVADLLARPWVREVVGADVSAAELDRAARRLDLARMPDRQRERVRLLQSSATYRDRRLAGYDALVLVEVLEHVDAERLPALERAVLAAARPRAVVLTTPNVERNAGYGLAEGQRRHPDHRFEWTRAELAAWAHRVGQEHGYSVAHSGIGDDDPQHGQPTQLLVLQREDAA